MPDLTICSRAMVRIYDDGWVDSNRGVDPREEPQTSRDKLASVLGGGVGGSRGVVMSKAMPNWSFSFPSREYASDQ